MILPQSKLELSLNVSMISMAHSITFTETNIVTVPTQNYECRISDSDKQAGKNDRDICKDTDKDSDTDLYRDTK